MESNPVLLSTLPVMLTHLTMVCCSVSIGITSEYRNSSQLQTLATMSYQELKEYEEKEYLLAKCRFYQGFRVKDREAFEQWIYKQWSPDQFNLEDDFRQSNYDNLYSKLLTRFNYTQRQIFDSCRNVYYPEFNDTRERTHREQFRAIYLIHREYQFKMDHWLRWLVDFLPYYTKKLARDRLLRTVDNEGRTDFDAVAHQFEYERRIDERAHECKRMIRDMLYQHGNSTLEEFAYEVAMGDRYFVEFNDTLRESFIKRCNMFLDLRQKHTQFLYWENKRAWHDMSQELRFFTRVPK